MCKKQVPKIPMGSTARGVFFQKEHLPSRNDTGNQVNESTRSGKGQGIPTEHEAFIDLVSKGFQELAKQNDTTTYPNKLETQAGSASSCNATSSSTAGINYQLDPCAQQQG